MPGVVNEEACSTALAGSTDPADRIMVLLVEGHAADAAELLAEARYKDPDRSGSAPSKPRSCGFPSALTVPWIFSASCWGGPGNRAAKRWPQHLGRSRTTPAQHRAAVDEFAKALDLRVAESADAALIYSSTVALQRARNVLDIGLLSGPADGPAGITGRMVLGFLTNTRWLAFWRVCLA